MLKLIKTRLNFALASGTITILGLMVGLYSGTHERLVVIGGILTIAIADAFSDALGFHVSREGEERAILKRLWLATILSFLFKFLFVITFIIPVLFLSLNFAILISIFWGFFILSLISYRIALEKKEKPFWLIFEHLFIASVVVLLTYYVGKWAVIYFNSI